METQKDLKDTEGFDWLESTELAIDMIDERKFLLNRFFAKRGIPDHEDYIYCNRVILFLRHFAVFPDY